jgi:hypothetical protein
MDRFEQSFRRLASGRRKRSVARDAPDKEIRFTGDPMTPKPQETVDTFIARVVLDPQRVILVYHRRHAGREFVRWRVFHKHRQSGWWYPDKRRSFVIPVGVAGTLGWAIRAAPSRRAITVQPDWLATLDAERDRRLRCLADLNAPPEVMEYESSRRKRAPYLGPNMGRRKWPKVIPE